MIPNSDAPRAALTHADFRFFDRLRVRWAEVDLQKVVFNGHYLLYIDSAIAAYWRAMALPYSEAANPPWEGDLYVRKVDLEYRAPARYEDLLDIGLRCQRVGRSSITFAAGIFRGDTLLVHGEMVYVFAANGQARPVPDALRDLLRAFEAHEPMVEVKVGDWATLGADAQALRTEVFVQEQKIPKELEWDAADAQAVHAVAYNRLGQALGTGRLLEAAPGVAKIGRMAVRRSMRGQRVGGLLLEALVAAARARGDHQAMLHAQTSAASFYLRAGFVARGELFEEAGIAHVEMTMALPPKRLRRLPLEGGNTSGPAEPVPRCLL